MKKILTCLLLSGLLACTETPSEISQQKLEQPSPLEEIGDNLLLNPGAEKGKEEPEGWSQDAWGENTPSFEWVKQDAFEGKNYLKVSIENYKSGDAKWIFKTLTLEEGNWYQYSDYYRSNGRSRLVKVCEDAEGKQSFRTVWQSHYSQGWEKASFRFYHPKKSDCKVSIMHIVDRNGFLETDHHKLVKVKASLFDKPMVSITFDDIWASAATKGATELQKRGLLGTFYVTEKYAQTGGQYASAEQVRTLIASGHEVGTHGEKHSFLSQQSNELIAEELKSSLQFLSTLRGDVKGIAYPFGDFNHLVEDESKRQYSYARTSLHGLNDLAINPYRLKIFAVTSDTKTEDMKQMIDIAEESSSWLIFLFHDLGKIEDKNTYLTDADQYVQILDYIKRKSLKVVTVAEGVKLLN